MRRSRLLVLAIVIGLVAAACAGGAGDGSTSTAGDNVTTTTSAATSTSSDEQTTTSAMTEGDDIDALADIRFESPVPLEDEIETRGPDGETPVWYTDVYLTPDELEEIQAGEYKVAMVWHGLSPFMNALILGTERAAEAMGMEVVATTDANFDQAKLANDLQSVLALNPDAIITIALDPVADVATFQPAIDQGVELVFASVKPDGYAAGDEYVSLVTYDIAGLGQVTANQLCEDLNGEGTIGMIFYDANFFVTNQREAAFEDTLAVECSGVSIAEKAGMADPARTEEIANALITRNPDINAIFAPWDGPAEGVVAALRAAGRDDVGVYTIDLGGTNALDMVSDGNMRVMTSTLAVEFGITNALMAAYGLLDKEAPEMVIVPAFPVTADNLSEGWQATFGEDLPADLAAAVTG